jgi:hypothetical protein
MRYRKTNGVDCLTLPGCSATSLDFRVIML